LEKRFGNVKEKGKKKKKTTAAARPAAAHFGPTQLP
jgi:hypothetical protein